jgi:hypothetical protein
MDEVEWEFVISRSPVRFWRVALYRGYLRKYTNQPTPIGDVPQRIDEEAKPATAGERDGNTDVRGRFDAATDDVEHSRAIGQIEDGVREHHPVGLN